MLKIKSFIRLVKFYRRKLTKGIFYITRFQNIKDSKNKEDCKGIYKLFINKI